MKLECAFGDVVLTDFWTVSDVDRPAVPREVSTENPAGSDGALLLAVRYGSYTVSFSLWTHVPYMQQTEQLAQIAHAFDVERPARLWFSDDHDRYRLALPNGAPEVTRHIDAACVKMSLLVPEPALYGCHASVQVPSGGSVTFLVGGTYPTCPKVTAASAVRAAASGVWGVRLDEGDVLKVPLASSAAWKVELGCKERECRVAGSPALPTLDSDWFELKPGTHTITNFQGTGACTVEWDERWL